MISISNFQLTDPQSPIPYPLTDSQSPMPYPFNCNPSTRKYPNPPLDVKALIPYFNPLSPPQVESRPKRPLHLSNELPLIHPAINTSKLYEKIMQKRSTITEYRSSP